MNLQETAQSLINDLQKELTTKTEESLMLKGAIQGVNLFYTNLTTQAETDEGKDSKDKSSKTKVQVAK